MRSGERARPSAIIYAFSASLPSSLPQLAMVPNCKQPLRGEDIGRNTDAGPVSSRLVLSAFLVGSAG